MHRLVDWTHCRSTNVLPARISAHHSMQTFNTLPFYSTHGRKNPLRSSPVNWSFHNKLCRSEYMLLKIQPSPSWIVWEMRKIIKIFLRKRTNSNAIQTRIVVFHWCRINQSQSSKNLLPLKTFIFSQLIIHFAPPTTSYATDVLFFFSLTTDASAIYYFPFSTNHICYRNHLIFYFRFGHIAKS